MRAYSERNPRTYTVAGSFPHCSPSSVSTFSRIMLITPSKLLTPAMIFVGILSSMALDAGYVVLPPIAAALDKSVGRSPLVGIAAAFVGVSAGFSANLVPTGLDPLLAGFTVEGAQLLDKLGMKTS